jgi:hypothetical protein
MEEGSAVCADNMGRLPGENDDAMDTETFMMAGFMILPMLFVLFGLMQRMNQRRRELPPVRPRCTTQLDPALTGLRIALLSGYPKRGGCVVEREVSYGNCARQFGPGVPDRFYGAVARCTRRWVMG